MKNAASKKVSKGPRGFFDTVVGIVLALLLMAGVVALWAVPLFHMADDFLLHFTGTPAITSRCRVNVTGGIRTRDESLEVRYTIADGTTFSFDEDINFNNWARNPDDSTPCEVRYAPSSPWRYSTDWGFGRLLSRLLVFLVLKG